MLSAFPRPGDQEAEPAETVRWDILMHASELFLHYGFSKTNIGDIAKRAGMSPGNLYRYFKNKQGIGLAVIGKYFEMVQAGMDTVLMFPEGTPRERIHRFLRREVEDMVSKLQEMPRIVEMAEFMWDLDEGVALLNTHLDWKRERVVRELQKGIDKGDFMPCDDLEGQAWVMMNTLKSYCMPMTLIRWHDQSTVLPEFDASLDLIFRGIAARPA